MSHPAPRPARAGLAAATARQAQLIKPSGSLGALEKVILDLALIQNAERPLARPAAAIVFAADHPVVKHAVETCPGPGTSGMIVNAVRGGAAASVATDWIHGIPLEVHDVGVDTAYEIPTNGSSAQLFRHRFDGLIAGDLRAEDAMSAELFTAAVTAGRTAVLTLEPQPKVLILGEMGIGNTVPASAVSAALLKRPVEEFLAAPGQGGDGASSRREREVVADALARLASTDGPLEVLRRVGGRELAAIVGAVQGAREIGAAVLVDGFTVATAVYAAVLDDPALRQYLIFGHRSGEPGHALLLEAMDARPLLDLGLRLGEGSGALAAFGLVEYAARLHSDMAPFAEAVFDGSSADQAPLESAGSLTTGAQG